MPILSKQKRDPCFLEWLLDVLNRKRSPNNAYWLDQKARIFAVRWVHAKSPMWTQECAELFKLWKAEGSRSWRNRSKEVDKHMKTNFRMNLRSSNFEEITSNYDEDRFKYPVRVFKVKRTNSVGKTKISQREEDYYEHDIRNGQATNEFHTWCNNSLTNDRTLPCKMSNPDVPNEFSDQRKEWDAIGCNVFNEDCIYSTAELIFENCFADLENLSFPGCIPQLLPCNQGNNTSNLVYSKEYRAHNSTKKEKDATNFEPLVIENPNCISQQGNTNAIYDPLEASSLVTSPTDSGFMDRLSFSSMLSCDTTENFHDSYPWLSADFSDQVFV